MAKNVIVKNFEDSYLQCVSMLLAKRFVFLGEEGLAFQTGAAYLRKNTKVNTLKLCIDIVYYLLGNNDNNAKSYI